MTQDTVSTASTAPDKPKAWWGRPANINLEIIFAKPNRKVTPRDLEQAGIAAAAAARAVLEGKYKPYQIEQITGVVSYAYVQDRQQIKG